MQYWYNHFFNFGLFIILINSENESCFVYYPVQLKGATLFIELHSLSKNHKQEPKKQKAND